MLKSVFMVALMVFITGIQRTCMIGRLGQFSSALCSRGQVLGMRSQGWNSRSALSSPHRLQSFLDGSDYLLKGQALERWLCSKKGYIYLHPPSGEDSWPQSCYSFSSLRVPHCPFFLI